jgi:hypothetical protein
MDLNTDMSKTAFTTIALAAILSLSFLSSSSVLAATKVPAQDTNDDGEKNSGVDKSSHDTKPRDIIPAHNPDDSCPKFSECAAIGEDPNNGNSNNNNHHKVNHKINEINSLFRSKPQSLTPVGKLLPDSAATTVPNGLNATFFNASTPYCWYVVNAPPCYDIKTGTVIR